MFQRPVAYGSPVEIMCRIPCEQREFLDSEINVATHGLQNLMTFLQAEIARIGAVNSAVKAELVAILQKTRKWLSGWKECSLTISQQRSEAMFIDHSNVKVFDSGHEVVYSENDVSLFE